ncbi:MAG: hypothetical protein GYB65_19780 [Chloroflexi bacterium]|nr:hypothetical protein [Chloroflexota bacterium]
MTTSPLAGRHLKGALIGADEANPLASVIVFQYNPATMTRRIEPRSTQPTGQEPGNRAEAMRLSGPPKETISLTVEIDAADQIPSINPLAVVTGVYPTLSALEMLVYPKSSTVLANAGLAEAGFLEIIPPEMPLTLFIWGPQRVLPVRVESFSITEEAFDGYLNPIRAKVELSLGVLSYYDLARTHPGYSIFMVHQVAKEVMATSNVLNSVQDLGSGLKIF